MQDVVILCHGFASNKNGFHLPDIATALAKRDLSSLRIDLRGNGESEGPFKYANYLQEVGLVSISLQSKMGNMRRSRWHSNLEVSKTLTPSGNYSTETSCMKISYGS